MDVGQAPGMQIPSSGTTPVLGVCMFLVAAYTFVPATRKAVPDLNGTKHFDPHASLFLESKLAMEQRQGWQRPTVKGLGDIASSLVNIASDAAPELGTVLGLPLGSTRGCAGGGGTRCGTNGGTNGGDGGAGSASYTRCTAPGCDWKTRSKSESSMLSHWRQMHRDIDTGQHGCMTSDPEVPAPLPTQVEEGLKLNEATATAITPASIVTTALNVWGDLQYKSFETRATMQRAKEANKKVYSHTLHPTLYHTLPPTLTPPSTLYPHPLPSACTLYLHPTPYPLP